MPQDRGEPKASQTRFDALGTLLLALTLAAYALAMTTGRGSFGQTNMALLAAHILSNFQTFKCKVIMSEYENQLVFVYPKLAPLTSQIAEKFDAGFPYGQGDRRTTAKSAG